MIIDINAFTGNWPSHPVDGDMQTVRASLLMYGVNRICVSPMGAAWCRNPHRFNADLYRDSDAFDDVWPVPVLDPTVATWREELNRATQQPHVRLFKLLPAYSPCPLTAADELLEALAEEGAHQAGPFGVIIQTRIEDPRRQHPLAQVPDVPAAEIADAAERHPGLIIIIGGPRTGEILALRERLLTLSNLYTDVSQADGFDAVRRLVEAGLVERLLFGSHTPFFIPHAALSRIVTDVSDDAAAAILGGNASRIIDWGPG